MCVCKEENKLRWLFTCLPWNLPQFLKANIEVIHLLICNIPICHITCFLEYLPEVPEAGVKLKLKFSLIQPVLFTLLCLILCYNTLIFCYIPQSCSGVELLVYVCKTVYSLSPVFYSKVWHLVYWALLFPILSWASAIHACWGQVLYHGLWWHVGKCAGPGRPRRSDCVQWWGWIQLWCKYVTDCSSILFWH